jgi:hypothetical protein
VGIAPPFFFAMNRIFPLVPKLYWGTKMMAKLSLASKGVPKRSLGTSHLCSFGTPKIIKV